MIDQLSIPSAPSVCIEPRALDSRSCQNTSRNMARKEHSMRVAETLGRIVRFRDTEQNLEVVMSLEYGHLDHVIIMRG